MRDQNGKISIVELTNTVRWVAALLSLSLLIALYFLVDQASWMNLAIRSLVLSVISNLIVVPIFFVITYKVIQIIQKHEQQAQMIVLASHLEQSIINNLNSKFTHLHFKEHYNNAMFEQQMLDAEDAIRLAVELTLQAATRMLVFPDAAEKRQLRAFCHLVDRKQRELYPFAFWSPQDAKDSKARLPYEGPDSKVIVAAEAFTRKMFVAKDLPEDHLLQLTPQLRRKVDPKLKYVVAAPIISEDGLEVLGTITFDSITDTVSQVGFNSEVAQKITEVFASSLFHILKLNERLKEKAEIARKDNHTLE